MFVQISLGKCLTPGRGPGGAHSAVQRFWRGEVRTAYTVQCHGSGTRAREMRRLRRFGQRLWWCALHRTRAHDSTQRKFDEERQMNTPLGSRRSKCTVRVAKNTGFLMAPDPALGHRGTPGLLGATRTPGHAWLMHISPPSTCRRCRASVGDFSSPSPTVMYCLQGGAPTPLPRNCCRKDRHGEVGPGLIWQHFCAGNSLCARYQAL